MKLTKREANAILQSLTAGVTPRLGLRHIVSGRAAEIKALIGDLSTIRDGGASVRFLVGSYGSGKSFLLQIARLQAMEGKFVVADADLSPERRLHGSDNQALALYRELMKNLSTQVRPDGNALQALIEKWLSGVQADVTTKQQIDPGHPEFSRAVQIAVTQTLSGMQELVHGFDFAQVINAYYRGYLESNDALKNDALRWLRGELSTKTEANKALGVRSVIDDSNWYDYLKAFARFVRAIGYSGLLVSIDELVNLYKITHSISRNNNYEQILKVLNDCLQGRASHIGFLFGATPESMDNEQRGLFSYEALRTRLNDSRFVQEGLRDMSSPVLRLPPLTPEEIFVLLGKVRDIHRDHVANSRPLDDLALQAFMGEELRRIGASQFTTPRELVRDFLQLSNLLAQYPDRSWQELLGTMPVETKRDPNERDALADFSAPEGDSLQGDISDRFSTFQM
jgi:hypothetical protein